MKKKILAVMLCVAMLAIALIGGTMAYFTDAETVSNVMTMGNVEIEITEKKLDGSDFTASDITVLPSQNAGLVADGTPLSEIKNFVEKGIWVENTGNTKAYVRTIILFEVPNEGTVADGKGTDGYAFFNDKVWVYGNVNYGCAWDFADSKTATIDGTEYGILVRTYETALDSKEKYEPLSGFAFDKSVTSDEAAAMGATYDVLVLSQAVQAEGFGTAADAFAATYGDVTAANVPGWFAGN